LRHPRTTALKPEMQRGLEGTRKSAPGLKWKDSKPNKGGGGWFGHVALGRKEGERGFQKGGVETGKKKKEKGPIS